MYASEMHFNRNITTIMPRHIDINKHKHTNVHLPTVNKNSKLEQEHRKFAALSYFPPH